MGRWRNSTQVVVFQHPFTLTALGSEPLPAGAYTITLVDATSEGPDDWKPVSCSILVPPGRVPEGASGPNVKIDPQELQRRLAEDGKKG